ncbi:MAG: hypothetical protein ABSD02_22845 [Steroidobacteraceae bacterium]|jgi:hypothetical protein
MISLHIPRLHGGRLWNRGYLTTFLPATGAPGVLTANLLDPATSAAGGYAGEVAAVQLNIAFSDAGMLKTSHNGEKVKLCSRPDEFAGQVSG